MNNRSATLFSAGMDSFLSWYLFAPDTDLVFVDIGQAYRNKELHAASAIAAGVGRELVVLLGAQIGGAELPSGIIPHRNAHLILSAASRGYSRILLGVLHGEINSDKSDRFFFAMEEMLGIAHEAQYWNGGVGTQYAVGSVISTYTKTELVGEYMRRAGPIDLLLRTVSCYEGANEDRHCGNCASCFKRWVALVNNKIEQDFDSNPVEWAWEQGVPMKCLDGTYHPRRAGEILAALDVVGESIREAKK